jgi:hypothetical protein
MIFVGKGRRFEQDVHVGKIQPVDGRSGLESLAFLAAEVEEAGFLHRCLIVLFL